MSLSIQSFTPFLNKYELTKRLSISSEVKKNIDQGINKFKDIYEFINSLGASSFDHGLYRIHSFESAYHWTNELRTNFFPAYTNKLYCFGFDWMGRQFSLSSESAIFIFDPASFKIKEYDSDIISFHTEVLVTREKEILLRDMYDEWKKGNSAELEFNQCAGFKIPLFLGGETNINNCTLIDIKFYWEFNFQLYLKIKDLPEGTKIRNVKWVDPKISNS